MAESRLNSMDMVEGGDLSGKGCLTGGVQGQRSRLGHGNGDVVVVKNHHRPVVRSHSSRVSLLRRQDSGPKTPASGSADSDGGHFPIPDR